MVPTELLQLNLKNNQNNFQLLFISIANSIESHNRTNRGLVAQWWIHQWWLLYNILYVAFTSATNYNNFSSFVIQIFIVCTLLATNVKPNSRYKAKVMVIVYLNFWKENLSFNLAVFEVFITQAVLKIIQKKAVFYVLSNWCITHIFSRYK